jgi:hypothetical protein
MFMFLYNFRLSLSSIGSPSSNDELQSPTGKSGDKLPGEDSDDNSFTSYHPRPIAVSYTNVSFM